MEKQFAASEVHRLSNRIPRSNDEIADAQEALRAFADMLEAQEKAVPVAITCYGDDDERNGYIRTKKTLPTDMKLYAHPAPSDAERLAEALRWIMRTAEDAKEPCGGNPESPAAIRNGALACISQAAPQSLGIVQGPGLVTEIRSMRKDV